MDKIKYICEGTIVRDKKNPYRTGEVILYDRSSKIVVAREEIRTWAAPLKDIEVISYKEVK